jgi:hypothetical protein
MTVEGLRLGFERFGVGTGGVARAPRKLMTVKPSMPVEVDFWPRAYEP